MRSKTPLAMMEQVVMVLVFALAAALCLQVFAVADRLSEKNRDRDHAVLLAQNTAETVKACGGVRQAAEAEGGELRQMMWSTFYAGDLTPVKSREEAVYVVDTQPENSGTEGLGSATVAVFRADGQEALVSLPVAWQEVSGRG